MGTPIELTNAQVIKVAQGLKSLDGVMEGKGELKRFEFQKNIYWDIIRDQVVIDKAKEIFDIYSQKLLHRFGLVDGEGVTAENQPRYLEYREAYAALLEQTQEVDVVLLRTADLEAKNNRFMIPPSVMVNLWPILEETTIAPAAR